MATSTTALHPQFRAPQRAPGRLRPLPHSSYSSFARARPRTSVRASAASASAPVQPEAVAGVQWGCEIESLESAASLERWLIDSGLPEQRLAIQRVDIGERGLVALKNIRKGEKLLFVPPSLVITADSVTKPLSSYYPRRWRLSSFKKSCYNWHSIVFVFPRSGAAQRWGM